MGLKAVGCEPHNPGIGPLAREGLVRDSSSLEGLLQEWSHICGSQFPGRGGGDAWRHRSSHFRESQLRLHLLYRKEKRELNSSAVRRELARREELTTMFHKGRVFLFMIQQRTSLAFKKNLGTGFPWRQLPNNPIQSTLIMSVCAALGFSQEVQNLTSFLILAVFVSSDSSLPVCRQRPPGVEDPAGGVPLDRRVLGGSAQLPKMHNGTIGRSRLGDL